MLRGKPNFQHYMQLMRKHNPHLRESGFHFLLSRASDFVPELIVEFENETDHGLRCWLLELLASTKYRRALPLLIQQAQGADELLRVWAVRGLEEMDSRESRTALLVIGSKQKKQSSIRRCEPLQDLL